MAFVGFSAGMTLRVDLELPSSLASFFNLQSSFLHSFPLYSLTHNIIGVVITIDNILYHVYVCIMYIHIQPFSPYKLEPRPQNLITSSIPAK